MPSQKKLTAAALIDQAQRLRAMGRNKEALAIYEEAIARHPADEAAKVGRAEVLREMGQVDEAIRAYKELIAGNRRFVQHKLGLGQTMRAANRLKDAETLYREAIAAHPKIGELKLGLEETQREMRRLDEDKIGNAKTSADPDRDSKRSRKTIRSPSPAPDERQFQFSRNAELVLRRAVSLAGRNQVGITSSCILFGITEQAGSRIDTAHFVRGVLNRTGLYDIVFEQYRKKAGGVAAPDASEDDPLRRGVSRNAHLILEHAAAVALKVSGESNLIRTRHLFAALIVAPYRGVRPAALSCITDLGIELLALRREFREFIRGLGGNEISGEWDAILTPNDPRKTEELPSDDGFFAGPAGYTSEFCGVGGNRPVADHLGVETMADRLAELIALRETRLPLAIGLFGNWGSGKSHFMNLIDRKLKKLAVETPEDWRRRAAKPGVSVRLDTIGEGPWCREIVPIYFNAWHYLDTNLWASLVTEIFDGLSAHLAPKQDALALMRLRLREAGGATARAEEDAKNAHEAVRKASAALQDARAHSEGARQMVRSLMDSLRTLLPQINTPENQQRIVELLGVSAEVATLSQLAAKHREMVSLPGRIREFWCRATAREGLPGRFGWLLGTLIVVPGLVWLGAALVPQVETWLRSTRPGLKTALTALTGAAAWLVPVFKQIHSQLQQIESWQEQAEQAQAALPNDEQVIAAQENVVQAEAVATSAEASLAVARVLEQQLTHAVDDLRPERRLGRFIEARARSADYRGQLGLVSLARRDFKELSDIFADAEALQEKANDLPLKEAEQLKKLSASVDRIVLFVDDLDRCQPEKVADVLQAVHLLLAYPLFAVVVGVDQRCLKQSIAMQFRGLLSTTEGIENGERMATPLDYLEKIFHVPFHLPIMGEEGFGTLIEKLTEPRPSAAGLPSKGVAGADDLESTHSRTDTKPSEGASKPSVDGDKLTGVSSESPEDLIASTEPPGPAPVIGSVPLQHWERKALKDYHPLMCTPRGATRLLNTYRLVRAGIPANEWASFWGDGNRNGEFRVAMLLLASAAGFPAVARRWFEVLRNADSAAVFLSDDSPELASREWTQFKKVYDATFEQTSPQPTKELFVKWLDRVERFTF